MAALTSVDPPGPGKSLAKRKHCSPVAHAAPSPAKRAPPSPAASHLGDPVLAALDRIQLCMGEIDARLQAVESRRSPPDPAPAGAAAAAVAGASTVAVPPVVVPQVHTLATAVPAVSTGVPFIPPAAAVSPHLRSQILAGNAFRFVANWWLLCAVSRLI